MTADPTGVCFDIQRYSIHDGPGIRTTVFLKGCPLSCSWCHNPEGLAPEPEILVVADRCTRCGACVEVCPNPPASDHEGRKLTDRTACLRCGRCVEACLSGARKMAGRTYTVGRLLEEVERDRPFYLESGGGVTFSGGEPMMQNEFLLAVLRECRARGLHTAVDTCGCAERDLVLEVADLADLLLYDLKLLDADRHAALTGARLEPIVENLRALDGAGTEIWIRFPLIPGVTDNHVNVESLGRLVSSLDRTRVVHILPFHSTASDKYARLERSWDHRHVEPARPETVDGVVATLASYGLDVKVGG